MHRLNHTCFSDVSLEWSVEKLTFLLKLYKMAAESFRMLTEVYWEACNVCSSVTIYFVKVEIMSKIMSVVDAHARQHPARMLNQHCQYQKYCKNYRYRDC